MSGPSAHSTLNHEVSLATSFRKFDDNLHNPVEERYSVDFQLY